MSAKSALPQSALTVIVVCKRCLDGIRTVLSRGVHGRGQVGCRPLFGRFTPVIRPNHGRGQPPKLCPRIDCSMLSHRLWGGWVPLVPISLVAGEAWRNSGILFFGNNFLPLHKEKHTTRCRMEFRLNNNNTTFY